MGCWSRIGCWSALVIVVLPGGSAAQQKSPSSPLHIGEDEGVNISSFAGHTMLELVTANTESNSLTTTLPLGSTLTLPLTVTLASTGFPWG